MKILMDALSKSARNTKFKLMMEIYGQPAYEVPLAITSVDSKRDTWDYNTWDDNNHNLALMVGPMEYTIKGYVVDPPVKPKVKTLAEVKKEHKGRRGRGLRSLPKFVAPLPAQAAPPVHSNSGNGCDYCGGVCTL
jgi:hypothetical protein